MSKEETGIPRDFVLKQIENEIRAGFAFVAAARRAFKLSQTAEAESALHQAAETHQQAASELDDSAAGQVRAVRHELSELREAIDWLRQAHFPGTNGK